MDDDLRSLLDLGGDNIDGSGVTVPAVRERADRIRRRRKATTAVAGVALLATGLIGGARIAAVIAAPDSVEVTTDDGQDRRAAPLTIEPTSEALHAAVRGDDAALTRQLIEAGAPVDEPGDFGVTALEVAVARGNATIAADLVDAGAAVTEGSKGLRSPLHLAAEEGNLDVLEVLIDAADDVDPAGQDRFGSTPMMLAAAKDHIEAVRLLIEAGACIDCADGDGNVPLHYAIIDARSPAMVELLLDAGADPDPDTGRENLQEAAERRGLESIATVLREATDDQPGVSGSE